MLEVKWKVKTGGYEPINREGFNPCYVGSKMESWHC